MWSAPREDHNRLFIALLAALVTLAWLTLWVSDRSAYQGGFLHSLHSLDAFGGSGASMLVFVAGWTVMIVAMMLPTSLPLVMLFRTFTRRRLDHTLLTALLVVGYLGAWIPFGMIVYFGGWTLHEATRQSMWLEANAPFLGVGIVTLAGVYQFTPLKYHCLDKCRSPLSFVMEHWRGNKEASHALRLGVHHGLFCVGCCWSLMLLMFAVGSWNLVWMLALGAVMAVEKNVSWGRRISAPVGVVLLGWGLILGAAPALQFFGETTTRIALDPTNSSNVSGKATFTDTSGRVEVKLSVEGLPQPGAMYLAHIHLGSCAGGAAGSAEDHAADAHQGEASDHMHSYHGDRDDHAQGHHDEVDGPASEIEHPLTPIVLDSEGNGSSATVINGATVAELFSGQQFYVNVHAETSGSEELPDSVFCGDLRSSG